MQGFFRLIQIDYPKRIPSYSENHYNQVQNSLGAFREMLLALSVSFNLCCSLIYRKEIYIYNVPERTLFTFKPLPLTTSATIRDHVLVHLEHDVLVVIVKEDTGAQQLGRHAARPLHALD